MAESSDQFKITYQQESGPSPMAWEVYAECLTQELARFLSSSPSERDMQSFLEANPALVPGAWTPGTKSGHPPLRLCLIAQPELQGLGERRPDFMWIATHSDSWYPTLIEIEDPGKRIFRSNDEPTAEFTQARNQLEQWRTWFRDPTNVSMFMERYAIPDWMRRHRSIKLHMILIYGRRNEFKHTAERSRLRGNLLGGADAELMSFDRLSPDRDLESAVTARVSSAGEYRVIWVPPTLRTGPYLASLQVDLDDFDGAIDRSKDISEERKEYLKRRIRYWQAWERRDGRVISSDSFAE